MRMLNGSLPGSEVDRYTGFPYRYWRCSRRGSSSGTRRRKRAIAQSKESPLRRRPECSETPGGLITTRRGLVTARLGAKLSGGSETGCARLSTQSGGRPVESSRRDVQTARKGGSMTIVRYKPDPKNPARLTPDEEAFQDALTEEDIERLAREDPDNPPSTEEELARGVAARDVRLAREKTGLSQSQFAKRYRINLARLRDVEQGRTMPDSAFLAYIRVIHREPEAVDRALNAAYPLGKSWIFDKTSPSRSCLPSARPRARPAGSPAAISGATGRRPRGSGRCMAARRCPRPTSRSTPSSRCASSRLFQTPPGCRRRRRTTRRAFARRGCESSPRSPAHAPFCPSTPTGRSRSLSWSSASRCWGSSMPRPTAFSTRPAAVAAPSATALRSRPGREPSSPARASPDRSR